MLKTLPSEGHKHKLIHCCKVTHIRVRRGRGTQWIREKKRVADKNTKEMIPRWISTAFCTAILNQLTVLGK
jgi:hypothetical protein